MISTLSILCYAQGQAQLSGGLANKQDSIPTPTSGDAVVKAAILKDMLEERSQNTEEIKKQLNKFETRIAELDSTLAKERNSNKRVENLVERVQVLEQKESTVHENVLNVFQHNYKSAVINLMFMERELKPLELFQSSQDFFSSLYSVSNPANYPNFNDWFKQYKDYIEKNRSQEAKLEVVHNLINLSGNFSSKIPLAGPLAGTLLDGISLFMGSMKKRDPMRETSLEMIRLLSLLSQFGHDMLSIENEWESINKELAALQKLQQGLLEENFVLLQIDAKVFHKEFTRQMDANKRIDYIKDLSKTIAETVRKEKEKNPEKWKSVFHYQMQSVKSLKIRFGTLTFRIRENIEEYKELIERYSKAENKEFAVKMLDLKSKLERLNNAFDATFDPQQYIESANQMYIVD